MNVRCSLLFLLLLALLLPSAAVAERFGDLVVAPQSLISGETQHGYREIRVLVENLSVKSAHRLTLVFPNRSYGSGNCLSSVSRTVTVNPASRVIVPLWLPPLPAMGDGSLRVEIDDDDPQIVSLPGIVGHVTSHGPRYGGGYSGGPYNPYGEMQMPGTILVSRSLNFDELQRSLKGELNSFAASEATGKANSTSHRGAVNTAWMPDQTAAGPHWIELEFDKPLAADHVFVHETMGSTLYGEIVLTGISGTNLGRIPLTSASSPRMRRPSAGTDYPLPLTPEPVKTVRLEFGTTYAGSISIDAVQLTNSATSNSVWASSAKASSEGGFAASRGGGPAEARMLLRAETAVADWSESWLAYTPFDAIALTSVDLKSMPAPVLTAVWHYAESGGNLILLGAAELPASWSPKPDARLEGGRWFNAGFGQCFVFDANRLPALTAGSGLKEMLDTIANTARLWQSLPDDNTANSTFPIIENYRVPVRGTVFIMLAFVVLIGPVNLIVLSRLNRRTWLLWTIPAISLATCLMVFAYSLLREGVTPNVRTESLTLLDQSSRRVITTGMSAFYCPLTPSQGLSFGFDTEATPLVPVNEWRGSSGTRREVDWTQAQHFRRGWVTARVPAHFRLRKSEIRRERLQVENTGGRLSVVNGLGAPIRRLWLADASGSVFEVENIAAGQKGDLARSASAPKLTQQLGPRLFLNQVGWTARNSEEQAAFPSYLQPNTYIAELETNPFLENGLGKKTARVRERAVVYGILDTPGPGNTVN